MSDDYRNTIFLPKTDFPMRGGLPKREPEILARWEKMDLYKQLRQDSKGREKTQTNKDWDDTVLPTSYLAQKGSQIESWLQGCIMNQHQQISQDCTCRQHVVRY